MNRQNKSHYISRFLLGIAVLVSVVTGDVYIGAETIKAASGVMLENPRVKYQTRNTIYFGNYWQEDTNGDGVADQKDKKTPIKWQILSRTGEDLFLLADSVLDCKSYNMVQREETWETCTLRKWLNEDFYKAAFNETEQKAIRTTTVKNEDNPVVSVDCGNDTKDKVYLPSIQEMTNTGYGFQNDYSYFDQTRCSVATPYAKKRGVVTDSENYCIWWLRSLGGMPGEAHGAVDISYNGSVSVHSTYFDVEHYGLRPVLHLNLSSLPSTNYTIGKNENICVKGCIWDAVQYGSYQGQPIIWRVLSVNGDDLFLFADQILATKSYNEEEKEVTWETCTLRSWLNHDFYYEAFSEEERKAIRKTTVINEDFVNSDLVTEGGNDTKDYLYLLSTSEIKNPAYGFPDSLSCYSETRAANRDSEGPLGWWLRSPGCDSSSAACVYSETGWGEEFGDFVSYHFHDGVRPALHLDMSQFSSSLEVVEDIEAGTAGVPPVSVNITGNPGTSSESEKDPGASTEQTPKPVTQVTLKTNKKPGAVQISSVKNLKKYSAKIKWKKVSRAKGYQIQYSASPKFKKSKTKSKKAGKNTFSTTIKKLKKFKKKKLYFRVRAYNYKTDGKKDIQYGKWSKVKAVKIKK